LRRSSSGIFIVLEGPDLSGKSTQAARLVASLNARGLSVVHTREPGGTAMSEAIRTLLLDVRSRIAPLAELLLYEAARAQHAEDTLRPALSRGDVVVSERYTLATLAYQGYGRGLSLPLIRQLNRIATGGLEPDLTIVVDASEEAIRSRSRGEKDRLESAGDDFMARVREGYRRLSKGRGVFRVDGARSPDEVEKDIVSIVEKKLLKRR
jgi:dTMP kinase